MVGGLNQTATIGQDWSYNNKSTIFVLFIANRNVGVKRL